MPTLTKIPVRTGLLPSLVVFLQWVFVGEAANPSRPNILFICTDDQAAWAMGASGNPQAFTPHMDRLASESAYLVNSFVTTPVCSPPRAATLTGKYGYEVGIFNRFKPDD